MSKYHEIFEEIPDGVILHDAATGEILDMNQKMCDMLGYSREEFADLAFADIIADDPPYTAERAAEYLQNVITDGSQTFEWLDQTKSGDPLPVEVHLQQTVIEEQDLILAVVRDISDRKRREQELQRKNERLEEFANVVSHDLRAPLSVAKGRLELGMAECDSEHLEHVARAHERMAVLIEDLLRLARGGDEVGEREPVDLAEVANSCWETIETGEAILHTETDRRITADQSRLQQLLENLFRNAIEHGGDAVSITVGDLEAGFYVEDDGPGIPADERDVVFEPGYSTSRNGIGFGLSIVDQIVKGHEWTIRAASSGDGGARFEVTDVTFA